MVCGSNHGKGTEKSTIYNRGLKLKLLHWPLTGLYCDWQAALTLKTSRFKQYVVYMSTIKWVLHIVRIHWSNINIRTKKNVVHSTQHPLAGRNIQQV